MVRLLEALMSIARLGRAYIYHNVDIGSQMITFTLHFLPFDSDVTVLSFTVLPDLSFCQNFTREPVEQVQRYFMLCSE